MEQRKKNNNNIERRNFATIELRAEPESRKVTGYAAVFDAYSEEMWGFREKIARGAFDNVLNDDVRALFNHDPNFVLARSKSGTLRMSVDERGLKYEFEAPNTQAGNDLLESIRRGDVDQSSFAFTVDQDEWREMDNGQTERTITRIKRLYDVSPVTYPAYPDTSVAQRSLEAWKAEQQPDPEPKEEEGTPTQWRKNNWRARVNTL